MTDDVFRVEHLVKRFGGVVATNDVSLTVARREFRAIIGPNGAGKSTLFNLVTGFLVPDAGRIVVDGRDVTGIAPWRLFRLGVSRTFQITNIFTNLTVIANVQTALLSHRRQLHDLLRPAAGMLRDEAEALLSLVDLQPLADRGAATLSHGDRKKLELAVALANEPSVLFLDEPTAGMAANERLEAIRMVKRIASARGLTVVFTEHDMQVIFAVADRISVLHQGRIIAEGEPEAIRQSADVQRVYLGGVI